MRHRPVRPTLITTAAIALLAACGDAEPAAEATPTTTSPASDTTATLAPDHDPAGERDEPLARLVVADAASPSLLLVDLDEAGARHEIELAAPASLSSSISDDGRFLFAAHDDAVSVVDGGVWTEDHGDHAHHIAAPPELVGDVAGSRPTHLISHDGSTALWFDGSGTATVLDEVELADGHVHGDVAWESELAHHGFAVPYGDVLVTTAAEAAGEMPDTVVVAEDGVITSEHTCTQTHGEATWAGGVAAACRDGILVLDDTDWTSTFVPYPTTDDVDPYEYGPARTWALGVTDDGERLIGSLGARHVLVVEPGSGSVDAIDVGVDVAMFGVGVDDASGHVLALTTDGVLRSVDVATGATVDEVDVLEPFSEDGDDEPYRQLVVADGIAFVSDPAASSVVEIDLATSATRSIDVGLVPAFIGLLGA